MAAAPRRRFTLLDGAMGTQIRRRGASMEAPLFSAGALLEAPDIVLGIHRDYLRAGADVITTNSFFTHAKNLEAGGLASRAAELTALSVALARRARDEFFKGLARPDDRSGQEAPRVAGIISPLVGSQRMDDGASMTAEYAGTATALLEADCDLLVLESFTEASALRAAIAACDPLVVAKGVEMWVSIVPGTADDNMPPPMLAGDPISDAIEAVETSSATALLLNCCAPDHVDAALTEISARSLQTASARPPLRLGVYPHVGRRDDEGAWIEDAMGPNILAERMSGWLHSHPRLEILGACCGSGPAWIEALAALR